MVRSIKVLLAPRCQFASDQRSKLFVKALSVMLFQE